MIKVTVGRLTNGQIESITVEGHAGSGPYGFDLVCAGVSSVTFGALNAIMTLCQIELEIEQADEGGFLRCVLPTHVMEEQQEKIQLLSKALLISLKTIEASYGEHIRIDDNGGDSNA